MENDIPSSLLRGALSSNLNSAGPQDETMTNENDMEKLLEEVEKLYELHARGVNEERCREFGRRMADLLSELEDARCDDIAGMVMDSLGYCSPKTTSHCETELRQKAKLESIRDAVLRKLKDGS